MHLVFLCLELVALLAVTAGVFLLLGLGAALVFAGLVTVLAVEWLTRTPPRRQVRR